MSIWDYLDEVEDEVQLEKEKEAQVALVKDSESYIDEDKIEYDGWLQKKQPSSSSSALSDSKKIDLYKTNIFKTQLSNLVWARNSSIKNTIGSKTNGKYKFYMPGRICDPNEMATHVNIEVSVLPDTHYLIEFFQTPKLKSYACELVLKSHVHPYNKSIPGNQKQATLDNAAYFQRKSNSSNSTTASTTDRWDIGCERDMEMFFGNYYARIDTQFIIKSIMDTANQFLVLANMPNEYEFSKDDTVDDNNSSSSKNVDKANEEDVYVDIVELATLKPYNIDASNKRIVLKAGDWISIYHLTFRDTIIYTRIRQITEDKKRPLQLENEDVVTMHDSVRKLDVDKDGNYIPNSGISLSLCDHELVVSEATHIKTLQHILKNETIKDMKELEKAIGISMNSNRNKSVSARSNTSSSANCGGGNCNGNGNSDTDGIDIDTSQIKASNTITTEALETPSTSRIKSSTTSSTASSNSKRLDESTDSLHRAKGERYDHSDSLTNDSSSLKKKKIE